MPDRVIYLASQSPRRRALVQALGLPVVSGVAPFDEDVAAAAYTGAAEHLAEYLARAKAEATLAGHSAELPENAVVVAADTTVVLHGRSLGKPRDDAEAVDMLAQLRNRRHQVITAVAAASAPAPGRPSSYALRSLAVGTDVTMRDYTDAEIASYVATGDPADKAGAYAIQHEDFHPAAEIAGCYLAVVGLPLCALTYLLASAPEATAADSRRYQQQAAGHRTDRCPWSAACRPPLPDWQLPVHPAARPVRPGDPPCESPDHEQTSAS
jgi:nucleoside triphosphate pyrophosphatase